jgi:hypothetical protein
MKSRIIVKSVYVLVLIIASGSFLKAQIMVSRMAPGSPAPATEGFFYTLPRTVFKVNLVLEKIERQKGPLSAYAAEYLGVSDVIKASETSYNLLDVGVESLSVTDPDQMYFVQIPPEKGKDDRNPIFHLAENGALLSVNDNENQRQVQPIQELQQTIMFKKVPESFDYEASYNKKKQQDTIIRKINIDTMTINRFLFKTNWVDKSEREKAEEAAQQITKIREARFNLLTGYHEVDFGESLRYMDNQLKKMEQGYLELFLGKETSTIIDQSVFYAPKKDEKQAQIWKSTQGEAVIFEFAREDFLQGLPEAPVTGFNNVYYRIPAQTSIKISYQGKNHFTDLMPVNQMGVISSISMAKARLHFDPRSGSLLSVIRE